MITKTLDDVMRRILNDPDIFYVSYSIFDNTEWEELRKEFREGNLNNLTTTIDQKIKHLKDEISSQRNHRQKTRLQDAVELVDALRKAPNNKPHILGEMFSRLNKFGLVKCNLPNMEDYGRVIENHNFSTVEQYFLSKIDKAGIYQKRALRKTLEYVKELYAMNLDILEIAFFVRKLNSLTQFMEVIKDE